jgi:phosphohistidine phosphatase
MKTLILLRHGEAVSSPGGVDFERALTSHGRAQARSVAAQLAAKGLWPDAILCSAARRTRETCEEALEIWKDGCAPEVIVTREIYGADVPGILNLIEAQSNSHACLMVIGHNPVIHQCVQFLAAEGELKKEPVLLTGYAPASCAVLSFNVPGWADVAPRIGTLTDYLRPAR